MKKRCVLSVLCVLCILFCSSFISPAAFGAETKNFILIGWDGAGWNNVSKLLAEGKLPNLQKFVTTGGGQICPMEILERTWTAPSWAMAFTGFGQDFHGVNGNESHLSPKVDLPNITKFTWTWGFQNLAVWVKQVPYNWTIFHHIGKLGYTTGVFASKYWFFSKEPTATPFAEIMSRVKVHKNYLVHNDLKDKLDPYVTIMTDDVLQFLKTNKKFFIFVLYDPDQFGHWRGEASERYHQEFVRCDEQFGRILAAIDRSKTKVLLMNDHGFNPNSRSHSQAPDGWLATDLPIHPLYAAQPDKQVAWATVRDVPYTILKWYGIDPKSLPANVPMMRGKDLLE